MKRAMVVMVIAAAVPLPSAAAGDVPMIRMRPSRPVPATTQKRIVAGWLLPLLW